ncbi:hypothetical protein [uncultured Deinococcus sp.]|uniref:hypothetical protein n=1 Tax=uncultured Deinococcus sp. TaxID=158789 RepID=UPI0025E63B58|nr:hypothetical protein [uncultured Deinococcus sp.]
MELLGGMLGVILGAAVALGVLSLRGPLAVVVAILGAVLMVAALLAVLLADDFSRPFGMVYVLLGAVLAGVAALPRLRGAGRAADRWIAVGLGVVVVAGTLLVGLGADAVLGTVLPRDAKARASSELVTGLLVGAVSGVGWMGWRPRRVA